MATEKSVGTVKPKTQPVAQAGGPGPLDKAKKYLGEVQTELKKTTWPTKEELISQTKVVLGMLVVVGVFIFVWDRALGFLLMGLFKLIGVEP
jgi:preprotein translocase subunit SecE